MIYLDNAATTQIDNKVLKVMMPYLCKNYGNPSASYELGRKSREAIELSRDKIAKALSCKKEEIYFTSGGSEGDNLLIKGIAHAYKDKGKHIITSKIEHPAVLNTCKELEKEGYEITYLNVDNGGFIDLNELKSSIRDDTILISIMMANNEIGTIEPIKDIVEIVHEKGVLVHTDAVQAIGNIKINLQELGVDCLSFSGHKIYAPKGIGAIYLKSGIKCIPLINGGGQESSLRSGTENVASIVGLGEAIDILYKNINKYINNTLKIKEKIIYALNNNFSMENIRFNTPNKNSLCSNINVSFRDIDGETLKLLLDVNNVAVSNGSACSSGRVKSSYVLNEINVPKDFIEGTIRITIGKYNTEEEIAQFIKILIKCIISLRRNINE